MCIATSGASPTHGLAGGAAIVVSLSLALSSAFGAALVLKEVSSGQTGASTPTANPAQSGLNRPIRIFREHCVECHDPDGRGESGRDVMRKIPDFTDPKWHIARNDHDLARSVLNGRGAMPAWKAKLSGTDVERLVVLVRNFRGGAQRVPDDDDHVAPVKPDDTPDARPLSLPSARRPERSGPPSPSQPASPSATPSEASRTFSRLCVACHGKDGRSESVRARVAWAPDFTSPDWHKQKEPGRLVISILEGKGNQMPPFSARLNEPEAREIVDYLRSLADIRKPSAQPDLSVFDGEFQRLMERLNDLKQGYHKLESR